jgi:hypothetical protein
MPMRAFTSGGWKRRMADPAATMTSEPVEA